MKGLVGRLGHAPLNPALLLAPTQTPQVINHNQQQRFTLLACMYT